MVDLRIAQLPSATISSPGDLLPLTQDSTTPTNGTTRKITPALLAKGIGLGINVFAFGAVGNGVANDTSALISALNAVPNEGGTVIIPVGYTFRFNAPLPVKTRTMITGGGSVKALPSGQWLGTPYRGFYNVNLDASVLTDEDIVFKNIIIDYSAFGALVDGSEHCIRMRKCRRVVVEDCTIYNGASSVALLGCDDTYVGYNSLINFRNCGADHWDNPRNARVIGNYIKTTISSQMVNFNPEPTALDSGHEANGFVMADNIIVSEEVDGTPCQIEPLVAGNVVKNVTATGNVFKNSWFVGRGNVQGLIVGENTFSDFSGNVGAIACSAQFGDNPIAVVVGRNIVRDCLAATPNIAVIHVASDSAVVSSNIVMGVAYSVSAISVTPKNGVAYGNYVEAGPVGGRMQGGIRLLNGVGNYYGWTDTAGASPIMAVTNADVWGFWGTNSVGGLRNVFEMNMASDTSSLTVNVSFKATDFLYQSQASGLVATGTGTGNALVLTENVNQVATVASGTGVRFPNQSFYGGDIVVVNDGANALLVYPTTGGTIDSLAVNTGFSLPAGSVGIWTYTSGTNWRTKSVYP